MCQESEVGKEAGVCWEVDVGVAQRDSHERGMKTWMQFEEAVVFKLGVLLSGMLGGCCLLWRFWGVQCAGEFGC